MDTLYYLGLVVVIYLLFSNCLCGYTEVTGIQFAFLL